MHTYQLAPADPSQVEEIAAFIERVIETSVDASTDEKSAFIANTRKNLSKWLDAPDRCVHIVAIAGGQLAGVVLVREFWNLCHLFVSPDHQRHGLGRRLIEEALARCAGRSPHGLVRLNSSRNAMSFYRHMGFTEAQDAPQALRGVQFVRPV
jgi:GNAT superfamily N-acetyltransferase